VRASEKKRKKGGRKKCIFRINVIRSHDEVL
jgi:hypothetical protein